jgi:hypothetical protein
MFNLRNEGKNSRTDTQTHGENGDHINLLLLFKIWEVC